MLHGKRMGTCEAAPPGSHRPRPLASRRAPFGSGSPLILSLPPTLQNGDYNKPIPAQYLEHLNHVVSSAPSPRAPAQPQQWVSSQVLLCRRCSHHQTTKIKQLAAFSPRDEVRPGRGVGRGGGGASGGPCPGLSRQCPQGLSHPDLCWPPSVSSRRSLHSPSFSWSLLSWLPAWEHHGNLVPASPEGFVPGQGQGQVAPLGPVRPTLPLSL